MRLRPKFAVTAASIATYLGDPVDDVPVADGALEISLPRLGSAAVLLDLD